MRHDSRWVSTHPLSGEEIRTLGQLVPCRQVDRHAGGVEKRGTSDPVVEFDLTTAVES